jgi:hypothetical protein
MVLGKQLNNKISSDTAKIAIYFSIISQQVIIAKVMKAGDKTGYHL